MSASESSNRRARSFAALLVAITTASTAAAGSEIAARFAGREPSLRWDARAEALHVAYVEESDSGPRVVYRRLGADAFGPVAVSPAEAQVAAHGEVAPLVESLDDGTLLVAYPVSLPGKWRGELHLQRSTDGGRTWSAPTPVHDDAAPDGSHSFADVVRSPRGEAVFSWLDGRAGRQGVVVAATADGAEPGPNRLVDDRTCECCRTAMLAGPDDRLWLAYRDLDEGSVRDISIVASEDGGRSFGAPVRVSADGWRIDGCPHSGPRLAWAAPDTLWVVWFTGAEPGIYAAASRDFGRTFAPRESVATAGERGVVANPEVAVLPDGRVAVIYARSSAEGRSIELRARDSGGWGDPIVLAGGGFHPRIARRDGLVAAAWIRPGEVGSEIEVVDLAARLTP